MSYLPNSLTPEEAEFIKRFFALPATSNYTGACFFRDEEDIYDVGARWEIRELEDAVTKMKPSPPKVRRG